MSGTFCLISGAGSGLGDEARVEIADRVAECTSVVYDAYSAIVLFDTLQQRLLQLGGAPLLERAPAQRLKLVGRSSDRGKPSTWGSDPDFSLPPAGASLEEIEDVVE